MDLGQMTSTIEPVFMPVMRTFVSTKTSGISHMESRGAHLHASFSSLSRMESVGSGGKRNTESCTFETTYSLC